jgi:hypothetical protein
MSPGVTLADEDAAELVELLEFVDDWTSYIPATLTQALARFVGGDGYTLEDLRADLARFAFLLGGDAERLFPAEQT